MNDIDFSMYAEKAARDFAAYASLATLERDDAQWCRHIATVIAAPVVRVKHAQCKRPARVMPYRGIMYRAACIYRPWCATYRPNRATVKYLGYFATPEEAAARHDEYEWQLHHDVKRLNFPERVTEYGE